MDHAAICLIQIGFYSIRKLQDGVVSYPRRYGLTTWHQPRKLLSVDCMPSLGDLLAPLGN